MAGKKHGQGVNHAAFRGRWHVADESGRRGSGRIVRPFFAILLVWSAFLSDTLFMEPRTRLIRDREGREHVVLELADFQALLDASSAIEHGLPEVRSVVERLALALRSGSDQDVVDLDEFLARYDAAHGTS